MSAECSLSPLLDDNLRFLQAVEDFAVHIVVFRRLAVAVLPGLPWFDELALGSDLRQPVAHGLRGHFPQANFKNWSTILSDPGQ